VFCVSSWFVIKTTVLLSLFSVRSLFVLHRNIRFLLDLFVLIRFFLVLHSVRLFFVSSDYSSGSRTIGLYVFPSLVKFILVLLIRHHLKL
jgi:hypothetical protein